MFLQAVAFLVFKSSKYILLFVVLMKSQTVHLISRNIKILKSLNSKRMTLQMKINLKFE